MILFRNVSLSRWKSTTRFGCQRFSEGKWQFSLDVKQKPTFYIRKSTKKKSPRSADLTIIVLLEYCNHYSTTTTIKKKKWKNEKKKNKNDANNEKNEKWWIFFDWRKMLNNEENWLHTQNPQRFPGFTVVVVTCFVKILDDFHDFVSECVSFLMEHQQLILESRRFSEEKWHFFIWREQNTQFYKRKNNEKNSLRSALLSMIILLQKFYLSIIQSGEAPFLQARSLHPTLGSWIVLSPKQAAQPNPSYPALCRQDTTFPWSTDNGGNSETLILMPAIKHIWKKCKKKEKKILFSSEKWRNEHKMRKEKNIKQEKKTKNGRKKGRKKGK